MTGIAIDTSNGLVYVAGTSKSTLGGCSSAKTTFGGEMERMSQAYCPHRIPNTLSKIS